MKRILLFLSILCFVNATTDAQTLAAVDTGKYRINLPDYWKPGNKVWRVLTDKLPLVCEELADKELCGDRCNPRYSIEFEMSEPEIVDYYSHRISSDRRTDTWEIVTLYRFSSSLYLFDENDKPLTRLILVGKDEIWRVSQKISLASFKPSSPMQIYVAPVGGQPMSSDQLRMQQIAGAAVPGQSPHHYINNNKDKLSPTRQNMLGIIDEKIRSW
jgi:hypothetical protein